MPFSQFDWVAIGGKVGKATDCHTPDRDSAGKNDLMNPKRPTGSVLLPCWWPLC